MAAATWNHELVIGDTYEPAIVRFTDANGEPIPLTGVTGDVALTRNGRIILTAAVVPVDEDDGKLKWTAPASETAVLSPGRAEFALRLDFADGRRSTVITGVVTLVLTPTSGVP